MEYKIGEVSKILNISNSMIRYYEKHGALTPSRTSDNNYRTYSTMDIFLLMEIIRYQNMNFSIKDITTLINQNYMETYSNHLHEYGQMIDRDISYKLLLRDRIRDLAVRTNTSYLNLNNFWIKRIPALDLLFLVNSKGDCYERIDISEKNRKALFEGDHVVFFEAFVLFEEEKESWWYSIRKDYAEALSLEYDRGLDLPEELCVCTVMEMGDIGNFSRDCLKPAFEYMKHHGLKASGRPRGIIIGRGHDYNKFRRILEIQIPIEGKNG